MHCVGSNPIFVISNNGLLSCNLFELFQTSKLFQQRKADLLERERALREILGMPGFDERSIVVDFPAELPHAQPDWEASTSRRRSKDANDSRCEFATFANCETKSRP